MTPVCPCAVRAKIPQFVIIPNSVLDKAGKTAEREVVQQKILELDAEATRLDESARHYAQVSEEAIKKIEGVKDATVSFMMQKMTIDAEDDRFDAIMDEVAAACAKVEPDCKILR